MIATTPEIFHESVPGSPDFVVADGGGTCDRSVTVLHVRAWLRDPDTGVQTDPMADDCTWCDAKTATFIFDCPPTPITIQTKGEYHFVSYEYAASDLDDGLSDAVTLVCTLPPVK